MDQEFKVLWSVEDGFIVGYGNGKSGFVTREYWSAEGMAGRESSRLRVMTGQMFRTAAFELDEPEPAYRVPYEERVAGPYRVRCMFMPDDLWITEGEPRRQ